MTDIADGWNARELTKAAQSQPALVAGIERRNQRIAELEASNAKLIEALRPFAARIDATGRWHDYATREDYMRAARVLQEVSEP